MIRALLGRIFGEQAAKEETLGARTVPPPRQSYGGITRKNPATDVQLVRAKNSMGSAFGYQWVSEKACWDLLDEMGERDATILSCYNIIESIIMSRARSYEIDADDPNAEAAIELVKSVLGDCEELVATLAQRLIRHGVANLEVVWTVRESDEFLIPSGFYRAHPGQFGYDDDLNVYILKGVSNTPELAPPYRILHAYLAGPYHSGFGQAPAWPLRFEYVMKRDTRIAQIRNAQNNGNPIIHGKVPADCADGAQVQQELLTALRSLKENGLVVTARGEEIEAHSRSGGQSSQEVYDSPIDRSDRYMRLVILGSELATVTAANGNRSLGDVHERTMVQQVTRFIMPIVQAINEGVIEPLVKINLGENVSIPRLVIDTEVESESASVRETLRTAREIGLTIPEPEARRLLGIRAPLPDESIVGDEQEGDSAFSTDRIRTALQKYKTAVNMTAAQLRRWSETECSNRASQSRGPIRRNLRLLSKPADDWNEADANDAMRTVSFIARMRGAMGDPDNVVSQDCPFTKAEISLANWAWASPRIKRAMKFAADDVEPVQFGKATNAGLRRMTMSQAKRADSAKVVAGYEAAEDGRAVLLEVIRGTYSSWARRYGYPGAQLDREGLLEVSAMEIERSDSFRHLVASMMLVGSLERSEIRGALRESRSDFRGGVEDIAPEFADAVAWMSSRGVLSPAALEAAALAFAQEYGLRPEVARTFLRDRTLALARSTSEGVTREIQDLLSRAINRGDTAAEFLSGLRGVLDGDIPPGLDAYWNNVFRTEVANAYSDQQLQIEQSADIRDHIWGYEYSNPGDRRSRPSHAALNGVQVELNSPAFSAIGRPPFAYQCRCAMVPLILVDKSDVPYRTRKNAEVLSRDLSRFSCESCRPV